MWRRLGALFEQRRRALNPTCPIPMNKQKGDKRAEAYLTGLVNMMVERYTEGLPCNYDPHELTTITRGGAPLRTLSRRVDGAFPSAVNPVAVWEIKEYYYTTTFGSRVADGVYETLWDGMEIEELREHERIDVKHYLMTDAHFTWWQSGKAYLCRMFDMLHMGYVDEILFGREVVEEMPRIVAEWVTIIQRRRSLTLSDLTEKAQRWFTEQEKLESPVQAKEREGLEEQFFQLFGERLPANVLGYPPPWSEEYRDLLRRTVEAKDISIWNG